MAVAGTAAAGQKSGAGAVAVAAGVEPVAIVHVAVVGHDMDWEGGVPTRGVAVGELERDTLVSQPSAVREALRNRIADQVVRMLAVAGQALATAVESAHRGLDGTGKETAVGSLAGRMPAERNNVSEPFSKNMVKKVDEDAATK